MHAAAQDHGLTLRQAALIAGFGMLLMTFTAPFAEFFVYRTLVVPGDVESSVQNIVANEGRFLAGMFAYLVTFICDVLVAWALYVLLIPVHRSLSLLAAWFRLVHAVIALSGLAKLVTVFRILDTPDYLTIFGSDPLHAQVHLLLSSFRYEWGMAMVFHAIHLGLLGYLVWRSGYIPRLVGILLAVAGLGHLLYNLGPYLYPDAELAYIMIAFVGELVFMLWLLARGWKLQAPPALSAR
jgi:hypothetical protein